MTTNDAAERLRLNPEAQALYSSWRNYFGASPSRPDFLRQLDAALAAERHATVERIRAVAPNYPLNFRKWLDAILDAEAER